MTREETIQILAVLKAAYPHAYRDMTRTDAEAMITLWQTQFEAEPYPVISAAVNALISTRTVGYSPTVGEVREKLEMYRAFDDLTEHEAWALVSKACANGLYGYREEFEKLPPEVQRAVGAPEQLKAWAAMDSETVESVVASNFMRGYRVRQAREKELAVLPGNVREMLTGIADKMKMIPGK